MKYFISWYPYPPDPRYWKWFKIDGIMISLASLKGRVLQKALTTGLHRFTGFKGSIFLDSGAFQLATIGTRKSQIEILEIQRWLTPNIISHLDKPYITPEKISEEQKWRMLKETIENAKAVKNRENFNNDIQVVYVIQGWNCESLKVCAEKMSALKTEYYGLGSLYRQSIPEIVKRVKLVRKIIGRKPKLHVFGVSLLRAEQTDEQRKIMHLVDSFDSSSAIRAGIVKEFYNPTNCKREHINYFGFSGKCDCPVCKRFPFRIGLLGVKGYQRRYDRLRAIHNAYWLTKLAHSV